MLVAGRIAAAEQFFLVAVQTAVAVRIVPSVQIAAAVRTAVADQIVASEQIAVVVQTAVQVPEQILVAVRIAVQVADQMVVAVAAAPAEPEIAGKAPDIVDYKRSTPQTAAAVASVAVAAAARAVGSPEVDCAAADAKVDDARPSHHHFEEGCTPYYFHKFRATLAQQSWDQGVISHRLGHP